MQPDGLAKELRGAVKLNQAGPGDGHLNSVLEKLTAFLRRELPPEWVVAIDEGDAELLAAARTRLDLDDWWARLADAGYVTPTWPREYGGLELSAAWGVAVNRTLSRYKVPRSTNPVGVGQAGPALLTFGTEEQKRRFLPPIARHEEIWCQLFSEPGAGSDVAGLATRAVREGDGWSIRGAKVWTSLAHKAAFGLLIARTEPDLPKHKGITAFLLPMHQPAVTVRPLRDITGDAPFNEVFIDGAYIEDSLRLGPVNEGWRIAVSILTGERQKLSGSGGALPGITGGRTVESIIRRHAPIADPVLRQRLVQLYVEDRIIQINNQRVADRQRAGHSPGPAGSIGKLLHSEHTHRLQNLACDLQGPAAQAWPEDDRWATGTAWSLCWVRSRTIAGGTSEIQRNILGERVLGLPREPGEDRERPWAEVPR
jgi:alkylation response protein AidB-like acyl-CoA dehydrogenase